MFVLYLLGFIVWKPWRQQCTRGFRGRHAAFVSILTLKMVLYLLKCVQKKPLKVGLEKSKVYVFVK